MWWRWKLSLSEMATRSTGRAWCGSTQLLHRLILHTFNLTHRILSRNIPAFRTTDTMGSFFKGITACCCARIIFAAIAYLPSWINEYAIWMQLWITNGVSWRWRASQYCVAAILCAQSTYRQRKKPPPKVETYAVVVSSFCYCRARHKILILQEMKSPWRNRTHLCIICIKRIRELTTATTFEPLSRALKFSPVLPGVKISFAVFEKLVSVDWVATNI